jgi:MoxR-like ATPase
VTPLPSTVEATLGLLTAGQYVATRELAVAVFLALKLGRPLLLEGEAGVGKTEIAKTLAGALGRDLIRLQCYEGVDSASALYEWDYLRQILEIRIAEAAGERSREALDRSVFDPRFLLKRPLLQALEPRPGGPPVLLIDEVDRADEEFEAFLLHVYDWIDARVQAGAGHLPASQLARYAQVWEKIAIAARETEALNLDRRPLILNIFTNLAEASRD